MLERDKPEKFEEATVARKAKKDLYPEQILAWVEIYRKQNDGKFPSQGSGPVLDEQGQDIGDAWKAIDRAFWRGHRGLKDSGSNSLSEFLDRQYPSDRSCKEDLTEEKLLRWVEIYRKQNEGKFPSQGSGSVLDEQGQGVGETWVAIDLAFRKGLRGLKDIGNSSLKEFLDKHFPDERTKKRDLTEEKILEWVGIYRKQNYGNFPLKYSGPVLDDQGREIGETWVAIDGCFRLGLRGLKASGVSSLKEFLDNKFPDDRIIKEKLTEEKVLEWVGIYRKQNDSNFPSYFSGPVLDERGEDIGENWGAINTAFMQCLRGLKDSKYRSLSQFLDAHFPERKATQNSSQKPQADIGINSLLGLIDESTGGSDA